MIKSLSKKLGAFIAALSIVSLISTNVQAASYKVASGDSLYKIGSLFNTSSAALMKDNNLSGTMIYPGQVLNVPCAVYTVKSGDSLYLISKKFGLSLFALRTANGQWSDQIYPGQVLNLPGISPSTNSTSSSISYTSSDVDLLARLITAEAQDEPYNAMVSVGAVVVNRVKSSQFPNTISGVIYQTINGYYQFTPVLNGWINKPASQAAYNAARDALNGVDPTKGALFYFDDSTTNSWLWSKPIAVIIDKMVFVY